jgi:epoxyqueuosine reductase
VRSVVVLAKNYLKCEWARSRNRRSAPCIRNRLPTSASDFDGRIARYAWGDDYHEIIEKKLRVLDDWLAARGGRQRHYVDTGPVLERDFAALAGAGWHGKSTMLIHPKLGTWFFLAEVLTTLELEPDPPLPDRCGRCTRCIDACRRRPSPDRISWMRVVAFPTSRSNTRAASPLNFAR